jgi:hypothetical protein
MCGQIFLLLGDLLVDLRPAIALVVFRVVGHLWDS